MRKVLNIILVVVCGVVGAWIGYWVGYAAGWSENAEWPWTVGGGSGAILLSIGTSVLFVLVASAAVFLVPGRGTRSALAGGAPGQATVLRIAETGAQSSLTGKLRRQVSCELAVHPQQGGAPYTAHTTQFLDETFERELKPGDTVAVRYDPGEPRHVAIVEPGVRAA
jgi:hypothetical protein